MNYLFATREQKNLANPDHIIRSCESVLAVAETTATATSAQIPDTYKSTTTVRSLDHLDHIVRVMGVPAVLFPEDEQLPLVRIARETIASRTAPHPPQRLGGGYRTPDRPSSYGGPGGTNFSPSVVHRMATNNGRRVEDLLEARWFSQRGLTSATTSAASSPVERRPQRPNPNYSYQEAHAELRARFLGINRAQNLTSSEADSRRLRLAEEATGWAQAALEAARPQEAQQLLNLAMKACPSSCPTVISRITILLGEAARRDEKR